MNTTRGGLTPAQIVNLSTNEIVRCMFNPYEYTLSKTNSWQRKSRKGKNTPKVSFQQGGSQTLKLKLYFDTQAEGTDVRDYTDPLWKMMLVDEDSKNDRSGKSEPPQVAFRWGKLDFEARITSLSQSFTLFIGNGVPVRCTVDITLEQFIDVDDYRPQQPGLPAGRDTEKTHTAKQGERIDNIAADSTGDPNNHREVAAKNDIDDPLKIRPGQKIST